MSTSPAEHTDIAPKRAIESAVVMAYLMLPEDANPAGSIHGGVVMKHIDTAAGVVAMRHARGNAVTASVDRLNFMEPVYVGELVTFKACLKLGRPELHGSRGPGGSGKHVHRRCPPCGFRLSDAGCPG